MVVSMNEIQALVDKLGTKISAPKSLLVVLPTPADDGTPYVEIRGENFSYVSSERGCEIYRKLTKDLEELTYWIMSRVARQMAAKYELENRVDGCDTRKLYFDTFIKMLGEIKYEWGEKARSEVEEILKTSPYLDCVDARTSDLPSNRA